MLESMAGLRTGVRDAVTRYTRPITSAYYFVQPTGWADLARLRQVDKTYHTPGAT